MKLTVKVCLALLALTNTLAIELNCNFVYSSWSIVDKTRFYECEDSASSIESESEALITGVNGKHMEGLGNENVVSFFALRTKIVAFPRNLEKFFKNLQKVSINFEQLREIKRTDLEPLGRLKVLALDSNLIEILEKDLFAGNPFLDEIILSNNRIKFVDISVFKSLRFIQVLWFENNVCHSGKSSEKSGSLRLISEIREKCYVDFVFIKLYEAKFDDINALREENARLKAENEEIRERLQVCLTEKTEAEKEERSCQAEMRSFTSMVVGKLSDPSAS